MSGTGQAVRAIAMTVGAVVAYAVVPLDGRRGVVFSLLFVVALVAGLVPFAIRRARRIVRSPRPVGDAAETILHLATLIVIGFATAYYAVGANVPGQVDGLVTRLDGVYLAVTILSTVGFGDIVATGQLARLVVVVQMIADLAFLAVAVRVVTWAVQHHDAGPAAAPGAGKRVRPSD